MLVSVTLSGLTTPNTTRLSRPAAKVAGGIAMRSAMPDDSASLKSVSHFMPGSMASCSPLYDGGFRLRVRRRCLRIRADVQRPFDILASGSQCDLTSGMQDCDPAVGEQSCLRCDDATLRPACHCDRRKHRRDSEGCPGGVGDVGR